MRVTALPRPGSVRPFWRYTARQWVWAGIDVFFPPRCGGCERAGYRFCQPCQAALTLITAPLCAWCGYPLNSTQTCPSCQTTERATTALTGIRSVALFEGPLRHALHRLKYKRDVILADTLARLMVDAWRGWALPGEVVIPVPLSERRLRERGYNQAGLLARAFAELTGLRYAPQAVARIRHTESQVTLNAAQRQSNVVGAFQARAGAVAGRVILLIDDVCTTKSTLTSTAQALRDAGAAAVWGFTLGRAYSRPASLSHLSSEVL